MKIVTVAIKSGRGEAFRHVTMDEREKGDGRQHGYFLWTITATSQPFGHLVVSPTTNVSALRFPCHSVSVSLRHPNRHFLQNYMYIFFFTSLHYNYYLLLYLFAWYFLLRLIHQKFTSSLRTSWIT